MRRLAISCATICVVALSTSAAVAAEFHLDGRTVSGEWIGEADGFVHVLTLSGKREKFDRDEVIWIDWHSPVPAELAGKIVKARERFIRERRKVARALIKELERADLPERGSLQARFDGFDEAQSLHAFSDGLESSKLHVREFSFERLSGFESEAAVVPFVRDSRRRGFLRSIGSSKGRGRSSRGESALQRRRNRVARIRPSPRMTPRTSASSPTRGRFFLSMRVPPSTMTSIPSICQIPVSRPR